MTQHPETVPTSWTAEDEDFFRTTTNVFSAGFVAGAGVLLASYDDEPLPIVTTASPSSAEPATVVTAPASVTT
jgi:hypothetical protein